MESRPKSNLENSKPALPLSQGEMETLFKAQKLGDYVALQEAQERLKLTYLDRLERKWQELKKKRPEIVPPFDIDNPKAQDFLLNKTSLKTYNIEHHLATFNKISDLSTAGVREFYNILHSEDPTYMYNDAFLSLLVEAEADFLKILHKDIRSILAAQKEEGLCKKIRQELNPKDLEIIEEIYQKPVEQIIPFLKKTPVKVLGREVRAFSEKHVELEARILAANGVAVITTEFPTDTMAIYMCSFLGFLLGSSGGTYYTPSHSSLYVMGRKALSANGAQLLPDVYKNYRDNLQKIINEAKSGEYIIGLSCSSDPKIIRRLTYDRMIGLYSSMLAFPKEFVEVINKATREGHKIVLNCLNGCTWKTVSKLLEANGVNPDVFEVLWGEENPYFSSGYIAIKDPDSGEYLVDHLGIDTTMPAVVRTMPYAKILSSEPVGRRIYECDPDSDRFVLKQIVPEEMAPLLEEYGIPYYPLDKGRILASPSPNKIFLELDVADYERMKESGEWGKYFFAYFPTYVSAKAWQEFAEALKKKEGNIETLMCRVGFKNFNELQPKIEGWLFNHPDEKTFKMRDQLGREVELHRGEKGVRILSKEEESGGRVAGLAEPCMNILGQLTIAMPEKSVGDALFSELYRASAFYLKNKGLSGDYFVPNSIERTFKVYGLEAKIDYRIDVFHGDQGLIAQKPLDEQKIFKERSEAEKNNFNNFFFSLGNAVRKKKASLEDVNKVLEFVMPQWAETWKCIEFTTLTEEPLSEGRTRPEGVPMVFSKKGGLVPIVLELDFRPSATDPLKSKVYIDAEALPPKVIAEIEQVMNELKKYDLYGILENYGFEPVIPKHARLEEIGLKSFFRG
jgi:hypothetical protein